MPIYTWNDGGGDKLLMVLEGGVWKFATDAACCCAGADCYLIRPCKPNRSGTVFFCEECSLVGNEADMPMFIDVAFTGMTGSLADYNGQIFTLPILITYGCRYTNQQFYWCQYPMPFIDVNWVQTGLPGSGEGYWNVTIMHPDTFDNTYWDGQTDQPCTPQGSSYTGPDGAVIIDPSVDQNPCHWYSDLDLVVTDDLSAEVGKVIEIAGWCYMVVCAISCTGPDCNGFPEYGGSPIGFPWNVFDDCAACGDAPCACPEGLTGNYRIAGYVDGDLTPCDECVTSAYPTWDGSFVWDLDCQWFSTPVPCSMSGKTISASLALDTGLCVWYLLIECDDGNLGYPTVWYGEKAVGSDPTGVYNWVAGCDLTSALTIEAAP